MTFVLQDLSADCGICYAYRLDGQIPDQVCDDSRCEQSFHQACLYEVGATVTSPDIITIIRPQTGQRLLGDFTCFY